MANTDMMMILTKELASALEQYVSPTRRLADFTVGTFVRTYVPGGSQQHDLELVQIHRSSWTADSQKFTNIVVNLKELYKITPEMLLSIGGAISSKYLLLLAILVLCQKLHGLKEIKIEKLQIQIIEEVINDDNLDTESLISRVLEKSEESNPNPDEIRRNIARLEGFGIISLENDRPKLKEKVVYVETPS